MLATRLCGALLGGFRAFCRNGREEEPVRLPPTTTAAAHVFMYTADIVPSSASATSECGLLDVSVR